MLFLYLWVCLSICFCKYWWWYVFLKLYNLVYEGIFCLFFLYNELRLYGEFLFLCGGIFLDYIVVLF